jgi:Tyrosine phosphatase family
MTQHGSAATTGFATRLPGSSRRNHVDPPQRQRFVPALHCQPIRCQREYLHTSPAHRARVLSQLSRPWRLRDEGRASAPLAHRVPLRQSVQAEPVGHRHTAGLGIHTVIDLRSTREVERSGRIAEEVSARYYHLPMFENIEEYEARAKLAERPPPGDTYIEMLTGGGDAIGGTLRALLEAEGRPSVIHCTAGRTERGFCPGSS